MTSFDEGLSSVSSLFARLLLYFPFPSIEKIFLILLTDNDTDLENLAASQKPVIMVGKNN
jgi:hypothetical protein